LSELRFQLARTAQEICHEKAFARLCLGTTVNWTVAGTTCKILMLIEERESTNALSAGALSDAILMMVDARMICHEGHLNPTP
jgi:hypothetical protein